MGNGLVPEWHQANVYTYDDLMYTREISHMYCMDMTVYVTYECYMQAYTSGWTDAGLKYLQCCSNGDAAVLHLTIDITHS